MSKLLLNLLDGADLSTIKMFLSYDGETHLWVAVITGQRENQSFTGKASGILPSQALEMAASRTGKIVISLRTLTV